MDKTQRILAQARKAGVRIETDYDFALFADEAAPEFDRRRLAVLLRTMAARGGRFDGVDSLHVDDVLILTRAQDAQGTPLGLSRRQLSQLARSLERWQDDRAAAFVAPPGYVSCHGAHMRMLLIWLNPKEKR